MRVRDHVYKYDKVIIGVTLSSLLYSYYHNIPIISSPQVFPFYFEKLKYKKHFSKVFGLNFEYELELFQHLLFFLSISGNLPFSDKVTNIEYEDGELHVITGNLATKVIAEEILIFDVRNVALPTSPVRIAKKKYKVIDWVSVRSGMAHDVEEYKSKDNFIKEIIFYNSFRIMGNHPYKDLVAISFLEAEELELIEYSEIYARLKILDIMKSLGIKGTSHGRDVNNPERIIRKALKIEMAEREVFCLTKDLYEDFDNVSFIDVDLDYFLPLKKKKGYIDVFEERFFEVNGGRQK